MYVFAEAAKTGAKYSLGVGWARLKRAVVFWARWLLRGSRGGNYLGGVFLLGWLTFGCNQNSWYGFRFSCTPLVCIMMYYMIQTSGIQPGIGGIKPIKIQWNWDKGIKSNTSCIQGLLCDWKRNDHCSTYVPHGLIGRFKTAEHILYKFRNLQDFKFAIVMDDLLSNCWLSVGWLL